MKIRKSQFDNKFTNAQIVERDVEAGTFTAVASTATVDRHGEVVSPAGWKLENFKKNPVLLWSHDHTKMAIGKATAVWVEGAGATAKLMFKGAWQTVTEEGKAAAELVALGILNSFSVGFLPYDMQGNTYTDQELLEISLVNVPANPDAVMLAYKSLRDKGFAEEVAKSTIEQFMTLTDVRKDMFTTRGAIQDELDEEAEFEAKRENMRNLYDVFWAFCDVYYSKDTPSGDFEELLDELIGLFQQVKDGTFKNPVEDGEEGIVEDEIDDSKVIDKNITPIKTVDTTAKVPSAAPKAPDQKTLRTRQSITKVIAKASDQLLAGEKRGSTTEDRVKLAKIIKRGAEILSNSNKKELR